VLRKTRKGTARASSILQSVPVNEAAGNVQSKLRLICAAIYEYAFPLRREIRPTVN
jgi:hypothetical protein